MKDLKKGKIEGHQKGSRKTPHQQVMSKIDRRNQAAQKRQIKHQENVRSAGVFAGQHGAPRIVAVVPLSQGVDARDAIRKLNRGLDLDVDVAPVGSARIKVDRFKQTIEYVPVSFDLLTALDICRVADFIVLVMSPTKEVDDQGELMLKAIENQGVSNTLTVVQRLEEVEPAKKRPQVVASLRSYISHFFPSQEKVHSLDSERECANVIRYLCTTTPKGVTWREERSWMLIDDVQWPQAALGESDEKGDVVVTGFVRGKGLKADRLVQVGDWGCFKIQKITDASLPGAKSRLGGEVAVDVTSTQEAVLEVPDEDQDDLDDLAPYEAAMVDVDDPTISELATEKLGVLLDDHHYFTDDKTHLPEPPKRLPKGTSSYQAAWFLEDMSDSESDYDDEINNEDDVLMDAPALPQDGTEGLDKATKREPTEATLSEYPQSEMFIDPSPDDEAAQLAEYRSQRQDNADEDREFPDEIELHPNVLARERFARYRGLKSLKTSQWDTSEDKAHEPSDWDRLLRISDYKRARKLTTRETLIGGVTPGKRVNIYLRSVPLCLRATYHPAKPLALYSLLRHEQKRTVVNLSITLSSSYPTQLRSKETLILQCGPRRFLINPLYSQSGTTPNNVHKFHRFLHPGQNAIATFTAPLTWAQSLPSSSYLQQLQGHPSRS